MSTVVKNRKSWYLVAVRAGYTPDNRGFNAVLGPRLSAAEIDQHVPFIRDKLYRDYGMHTGFDIDLFTICSDERIKSGKLECIHA